MSKTKQTAIERCSTLLARSDQWVNFVGGTKNEATIDTLIYAGNIMHACALLHGVVGASLLPTQAGYIIDARQEYLNTRDVDDPRPNSQLIEGCPTDEEMQIASWSEGRGYGDFPEEVE